MTSKINQFFLVHISGEIFMEIDRYTLREQTIQTDKRQVKYHLLGGGTNFKDTSARFVTFKEMQAGGRAKATTDEDRAIVSREGDA